jgi:hypothetical protein
MTKQSSATISVLYDLRYYECAIEELEEYLLSGLRDWPMLIAPPPSSPPYPRLSPGAILISRMRLHPSRLDLGQINMLSKLDRQKDHLCERWQSAWQGRVNLDFEMNLVLWKNYLQEGQDQTAYYHVEIRQRVILDLLVLEMQSKSPSSMDILARLDEQLKRSFIKGEFIWQGDLQEAFPHSRFWYLYGQIAAASSL